jgi:hypothetical protein
MIRLLLRDLLPFAFMPCMPLIQHSIDVMTLIMEDHEHDEEDYTKGAEDTTPQVADI